MLANPEQLAVQGQDLLSVQAYDACFDDWTPQTGHFSGWDSGNHSVATLSSNQITGMGVGSTDAFASGQLLNSGPPRHCPMTPRNPATPTNVATVDHMMVVVDTTGVCSGCMTTVARYVKYQIQSAQNQNLGGLQIGEFLEQGTNTCGTGDWVGTTTCDQLVYTDAISQFVDEWSVNTDHVTPGCGVPIIEDTWRWCMPLGGTENAGTLSGYTHSDQIMINGVVSPNKMPQGTIIRP